jgi:hypothetical protein
MPLRTRRTWWIMSQEAPIFRLMSRKWRPVDRRERQMTPFALALPGADTGAKPGKGKPRAKNRMAELAEQMKKNRAPTWNPWMMTK